MGSCKNTHILNPNSTGLFLVPKPQGSYDPPSILKTTNATNMKLSSKIRYHMKFHILQRPEQNLSLFFFYDVIKLQTIENKRKSFKKHILISTNLKFMKLTQLSSIELFFMFSFMKVRYDYSIVCY